MSDYAVSTIMHKETPTENLYNHGIAIVEAKSRQAAIDEYVIKQLRQRPTSDGWRLLSAIAQEL